MSYIFFNQEKLKRFIKGRPSRGWSAHSKSYKRKTVINKKIKEEFKREVDNIRGFCKNERN